MTQPEATRELAPVRVMLVDDSAVIRGLYTRMISADPQFEIVASVANGQMAVSALGRQEVDVIVLDIEMPVMDGLTALPLLLAASPQVQVIMSSTLTVENAEFSLRAMQIGAADYIAKPTSTSNIRPGQSFGAELLEKIAALGRSRARRNRPSVDKAASPARASAPAPAASANKPGQTQQSNPSGLYRGKPISLRPIQAELPEIVAIGASTGGPQALIPIMTTLRAELAQPILITQHMPATFTKVLAEHLSRVAKRPCAEAIDGEIIKAGRVYIAPGGLHMIVEADGTTRRIRLLDTPPENFCRPAVDPMLRSIAAIYGARALIVILTGMGHDGLQGSRAIVASGGTILAQDEASSIVWGMPGAVATAGVCSAVLPLTEIAPLINRLAQGVGPRAAA